MSNIAFFNLMNSDHELTTSTRMIQVGSKDTFEDLCKTWRSNAIFNNEPESMELRWAKLVDVETGIIVSEFKAKRKMKRTIFAFANINKNDLDTLGYIRDRKYTLSVYEEKHEADYNSHKDTIPAKVTLEYEYEC